MSIVVVGLDRTGAIIATDTQLIGAESTVKIGKLFPFPHLNAVLVGRGMARLVGMIAVEIATAGLDFEDAAGRIPEWMAEISENFADRISGLQPRDRNNELFFVGWSKRRQLPVAYAYSQEGHLGEVDHQIFEPDDQAGRVLCAPWIEEMGPVPTLADLAVDGGIMAIAHRQCRLMNGRWAPRSAGGEIILAQIYEGGMVCRSLGPIDARFDVWSLRNRFGRGWDQ